MTGGAKLRLARQARGFSQQQLAGMAGVSRQAVSAVESGQSDPSLRVALALAQALGMTVEELFGSAETIPLVPARPVGPLGPAGRVELAPIGDIVVALPLAGATVSRAGFLPPQGWRPGLPAGEVAPGLARGTAAGEAAASTAGARPAGRGERTPPRPGRRLADRAAAAHLVVAGCDPALPLLEEPLSLLDPPIAFSWWPCSSAEALRLAAQGLVHAAGAHLRDPSGSTTPARQPSCWPAGARSSGSAPGGRAWCSARPRPPPRSRRPGRDRAAAGQPRAGSRGPPGAGPRTRPGRDRA